MTRSPVPPILAAELTREETESDAADTTHTTNIATNVTNIATNTAAIAVRTLLSQTATYDFAVDAGGTGEIASSMTIPDNAVITQVLIDIITAMASAGGAGTIALKANSTGDLLAAVDADTLSGIVAGIPVSTAATAVKTTASRVLGFEIGTEDLTAGKFQVHVQYFLTE